MVLWTIFVQSFEDLDRVEAIEIDSEDTVSSLRSKVSQKFGVNYNDLVLTGKEEYNYSFNSRRLSSIYGISDNCSLYAVYSVGGGKYLMLFKIQQF